MVIQNGDLHRSKIRYWRGTHKQPLLGSLGILSATLADPQASGPLAKPGHLSAKYAVIGGNREAHILVGNTLTPPKGIEVSQPLRSGFDCRIKVVRKDGSLFLDATANRSSDETDADGISISTSGVRVLREITLGKKTVVPVDKGRIRCEFLVEDASTVKQLRSVDAMISDAGTATVCVAKAPMCAVEQPTVSEWRAEGDAHSQSEGARRRSTQTHRAVRPKSPLLLQSPARRHGPTGHFPPGRLCESGRIPMCFPLQETLTECSPDAPDVLRSQRSEWNVRDSDATLILRPVDCDAPGPRHRLDGPVCGT